MIERNNNMSIDKAAEIVRKYEVNSEHHQANEFLISAARSYMNMLEDMIQRNNQEIANLNFSMQMQNCLSQIKSLNDYNPILETCNETLIKVPVYKGIGML